MAAATTTTATSSTCDDDGVLPDDVVFQILLWLPVMSLLRFKSVCKSWRSLIESSSFIDQHLHHSNYSLILMDSCRAYDSQGSHALSLYLISGDKFEVPLELKLDSPGFSEPFCYIIDMVTCNGIICLHMVDRFSELCDMYVSLWNPATKQLRALPQSPFAPPSHNNHRRQPYISLGFGLDVKTNDYKVVRIFTFHEPDVTRGEVYSSSTDSWRTIDAVLPVDLIISDPKAPYRNGTYCWLGRKFCPNPSENEHIFDDDFIFSFDFGNEVFGSMPLPDVDSVKSDTGPLLTIVRDNIACINAVDVRFDDDGRVAHFEIWMLNQYGVKESWTKLYKVGPFPNTKQIGLSKNDNFFWLVRRFQLCTYDLATQEIKNLPVQGNLINPNTIYTTAYKESLISVKRGNYEANSVTCAVQEVQTREFVDHNDSGGSCSIN